MVIILQVAIIYSLVSPGLWLLLDGTISGLIGSLVVSIAACSVVYYQNYQYLNGVGDASPVELVAIWLWIGSFVFGGLIVLVNSVDFISIRTITMFIVE